MAKPKGKSGRATAKTRPAKTAARDIEEPIDRDRVGRSSRPSAQEAAARAVGKPAAAKPVAGKPAPAKASPAKANGSGQPKADATKSRARPAPTKRTTPSPSARYTPPIPRSEKVSPLWVPVLMFSCLGVGMLTIILNYVNVLPGPEPSNVYLMIGLVLITVGFVTATKYH